MRSSGRARVGARGGHRWHVDHLGCPTLTEFLAQDRGGYYDYLVGKLLPPDRRERFSPEATVKEMRRRVVKRRRDGDLDRAVARELWDALGELTGHDAAVRVAEDLEAEGNGTPPSGGGRSGHCRSTRRHRPR